jgi:uncharacterized protein (DUF1501 family)
MLTISDPFRPGLVSRRRVLRAGAFGAVGLSLPQLLRAEAAASVRSPKSCILIFANGGPSQLDTFDPKPDAPSEIRGEFDSIPTKTTGVRICEHLPKLAALSQDYSLIRTISHNIGAHMPATYLTLTGHQPPKESHPLPATSDDVPAIGSVLAKFRPSNPELPSYVVEPQLAYDVNFVMAGQYQGYMGAAYAPYVLDDDPSAASFKVQGLELTGGLTNSRLQERIALASQMEARIGRLGQVLSKSGGDSFNELAFNLLSSPAAKQAFDLSQEPDAVRDRYGRNQYGQSYLMARRLIESGVRMVLVNDIYGKENKRWDNHDGTFVPLRSHLPETDAALSSLLIDLRERGMLDETLVVWMGEMGRGPKAPHGDHWPQCYSALIAGGGIQGGRVHGRSDKHAAYPADVGVTPGDVVATMYHALGLPSSTTVPDRKGRPIYVYNGDPIRQLF